MNGIFNILKPSGMSSNAVLTKIKKRFNIKKVGHLGTLDPAGTGVLPVTVGKATRLFDLFLKKDKVYRAVFSFGKTTDTLDSEGIITNEGGVVPAEKEIKAVLNSFLGNQKQMPPKFSAKNVNGKRAYDLAREGVEFELKPKEVNIFDIKLLEQVNENSYLFEIHCSSGTYIRSLARDIATKLNTYAFMSSIIRTSSGMFNIEDAITIEELLKEDSKKHLIGFDKILKEFPIIRLESKYYNDLINGRKVGLTNIDSLEEFLLYCKNEFFGIAIIKDGIIKITTYLKS